MGHAFNFRSLTPERRATSGCSSTHYETSIVPSGHPSPPPIMEVTMFFLFSSRPRHPANSISPPIVVSGVSFCFVTFSPFLVPATSFRDEAIARRTCFFFLWGGRYTHAFVSMGGSVCTCFAPRFFSPFRLFRRPSFSPPRGFAPLLGPAIVSFYSEHLPPGRSPPYFESYMVCQLLPVLFCVPL